MSETLNQKMIDGGSDIFHTPEYMHYISTHLKFLKESGATKVGVKRGLINQFEYNFYSLLVELKCNIEDFIPILLINGFTDPTELTMEFTELVMPDPEVLNGLKRLYRHQNKRV